MTINLVIYTGIALIILGAILYGVSCYMVRYYERKEKEIKGIRFSYMRKEKVLCKLH